MVTSWYTVTPRSTPQAANSYLSVTDQAADGYGNAHSLPNKLSVRAIDPTFLLTQETAFVVQFAQPVEQVSFWLTGTFHDTTVDAYDADGHGLETYVQIYPMLGPLAPDGSAWDFYYYDRQLRFIQLNASGISRLQIQPSAYDGFSIDEIAFQSVIPEPSSLFLLSSGLVGLAQKGRQEEVSRMKTLAALTLGKCGTVFLQDIPLLGGGQI